MNLSVDFAKGSLKLPFFVQTTAQKYPAFSSEILSIKNSHDIITIKIEKQ